MKWVTRDFVHFDRVASIWLIKRYIDQDAQILFVPWGKENRRPADAIPFALPGFELGPHDETGTTFSKILKKYEILDPVLHELAQVVYAGVQYVLHGYKPDTTDEYGQISVGMLAVSEGLLLIHESDEKLIDACLPIYDALYQKLRATHLVKEKGASLPPHGGLGPTNSILFMRKILKDFPTDKSQVGFGQTNEA